MRFLYFSTTTKRRPARVTALFCVYRTNMKTQHQQAFYSVKEVCAITQLGRTTIHRLMAANAFVAKVQLSPGRVAFHVTDVNRWIQTRGLA